MKRKRTVTVAAIVVAVVGIGAFSACGSDKGSECFYAPTCLDRCGGKVVKSGCEVTCDPPLVEKMKCVGMDAPDDVPNLIQDTGVETGGDAHPDAPADAHGG